ncbi:uncharacterized protein L201_008103 [Kwoniella dendrophila CBS 6074]|uniref:Tc1-like transposase DDE domain-containing protein n=1 Tax=Kwoniella dendrophila CBS 6074 TaxID=1295534 RepID=A0AAX4K606_9TREE
MYPNQNHNRGPTTSDLTCGEIKRAVQKENLGARAIASDIGVPKSTVQSIINRGKATGNWGALPTGPKKGTTGISARTKRAVLEDLKVDFNESQREVANRYDISKHSVCNIYAACGQKSYIQAQSPYLSEGHQADRLKWALDNENTDWNSIIWTDEFTMQTGTNNKQRVVRRRGQKYDPKYMKPYFRSGWKSISVWGAIAHNYKFPLVRCPLEGEGRMTKKLYLERILEPHLSKHVNDLAEKGKNMLIVEDGFKGHHADICKAFKKAHNINNSIHPACYPDLNPIENVWGQLKRMVRARKVRATNADMLWKDVQDEWKKLDINVINREVESMENRRLKILEVKGGPTKY